MRCRCSKSFTSISCAFWLVKSYDRAARARVRSLTGPAWASVEELELKANFPASDAGTTSIFRRHLTAKVVVLVSMKDMSDEKKPSLKGNNLDWNSEKLSSICPVYYRLDRRNSSLHHRADMYW